MYSSDYLHFRKYPTEVNNLCLYYKLIYPKQEQLCPGESFFSVVYPCPWLLTGSNRLGAHPHRALKEVNIMLECSCLFINSVF